MSLLCHECKIDMGPSEELPGREGALVYPNMPSLIYVPTKEGDAGYKMGYIESKINRTLCFECVEKHLPKERREELKKIYACYEAETAYRKVEEDIIGKWMPGPLLDKEQKASKKFQKAAKEITTDCLFCGNEAENGKPFFMARTIDKTYSSQHLSGVFVHTNYSWSNVKEGSTYFKICFDDFKAHFPRDFEQLSYDMLGKENPKLELGPNELFVHPSFEKAAEKEGYSLDDWVEKLSKESSLNLRIIRREKD